VNKIVCEYCLQPIGRVDLKKIKLPLTSDQFKSLMPERGVPDPFLPEASWEHWRCMYCGLRPFYDKEHLSIMKKNGEIKGVDLTFLKKKFICKKCGRELKHQSSLSRHEKRCNAKKHNK
jgi:hypothetical protein